MQWCCGWTAQVRLQCTLQGQPMSSMEGTCTVDNLLAGGKQSAAGLACLHCTCFCLVHCSRPCVKHSG